MLALSLRGSVGPIISGQTLTKATITMTDLELVDGSGGSVALSSNGFMADILGLQNQVGQLFPAQPVKAGRYSALRFHLKNAWVVAQDANGSLTAYASAGADKSQFSKGTTVQTLDFGGLGSDGFVSCAVAPGGVVLGDTSTLALHFALAQSLATSSSSVWVLSPVCWVVDPFTYSSLDVNLAPASGDSAEDKDLANGFQVMLLDSNLWPISEVALASSQSATYSAHFANLQSFQGPFVAALIPPRPLHGCSRSSHSRSTCSRPRAPPRASRSRRSRSCRAACSTWPPPTIAAWCSTTTAARCSPRRASPSGP